MIKGYTVFDCTLREVGYQTGWYFDVEFARDIYKFAHGNVPMDTKVFWANGFNGCCC